VLQIIDLDLAGVAQSGQSAIDFSLMVRVQSYQ
jgi:hypothetical protein